jgi:DNA-binding NarL/FixJ family response regulator
MKSLPPLHEKEYAVLSLWACGLGVKSTAQCLKITIRAVHYYRCKLRMQLGVYQSSEVTSLLVLMKDHEALITLGRALIIRYHHARANRVPRQAPQKSDCT